MASRRDNDGPRPCGLYRTILSLPGHADVVAAGRLVYFHNHSKRGPPIVLLPKSNTHNRWTFHDTGHVVEDEAFITALERLEPEGVYRVREHFHPDGNRIVAAGALVQLGYNRSAEPILFFPRPVEGENALMFPSQGMGIPPAVYALLEPLDLRGPHELSRPH